MTRLIDADKLPRHGNRGGLVRWKDIENAPTIDITDTESCHDCQKAINRVLLKDRPKRGTWHGEHKMPDMPRYEWYRCSECSFLSQSVVNYCPNCGANMNENYLPPITTTEETDQTIHTKSEEVLSVLYRAINKIESHHLNIAKYHIEHACEILTRPVPTQKEVPPMPEVKEPRKQGKWEITNDGEKSVTFWYKCSVCGGAGGAQDRYCRNCGARMEGKE